VGLATLVLSDSALLAASVAAAQEEEEEGTRIVESGRGAFVHPLRAEAGPVISPALSPLPRTELFGGLGFAFAREERGRAAYATLQGALLLGGAWAPEQAPDLGLGGELVALQATFVHTEVPPAIDEWARFADLGMLRVHVRYAVWRPEGRDKGPDLVLTPFLRLGLPTDTARLRPARRMPVRRVVDPRVFEAPCVLVEPGASLAVVWGPVSFFTHEAPVFAPVVDSVFHFFWSSHVGAGLRLWRRFELALESSALVRTTEDYSGERLAAFSVDPGLRLHLGDFALELSTRIALSDDARHPYGELTSFLGLAWAR
jgi:hypothetical protein